MKILSIAVPCYNSQDYMEHCVESLLKGGEDVEILIIDDGSRDATAEIADNYAKKQQAPEPNGSGTYRQRTNPPQNYAGFVPILIQFGSLPELIRPRHPARHGGGGWPCRPQPAHLPRW